MDATHLKDPPSPTPVETAVARFDHAVAIARIALQDAIIEWQKCLLLPAQGGGSQEIAMMELNGAYILRVRRVLALHRALAEFVSADAEMLRNGTSKLIQYMHAPLPAPLPPEGPPK